MVQLATLANGDTSPAAAGDPGRLTRMDTHVHSHASSGPAIKALGLIGCAESYSHPERVYEQARLRGMDLVTLTDHDTIEGGLLLQERGYEGVVLGEEVTVHFPEDRCKLHVLVWTLSPEQHEQIEKLGLRKNVYEFAAWLHDQQLPHALAHPLYVQNDRLTPWHIDRCALLFKGFETLNGAHSGTHRAALETYLRALTPGRMHRLLGEHAIEPLWHRAWEKAQTGGSDDHGLLNVGRTWTGVLASDAAALGTPASCIKSDGALACGREFFRVVMAGHAQVGGESGHSSLLAHQLTTVGAQFAARAWVPKASPRGRAFANALLAFAGARVPKPGPVALVLDTARVKVKAAVLRGRFAKPNRLAPLAHALREGLAQVSKDHPQLLARLHDGQWVEGTALSQHDACAAFCDDLYAAMHRVLAVQAGKVARNAGKGRRGVSRTHQELLDLATSYLALEATQLPTLFSLFHQNKERPMVQALQHNHATPGDGVSVLERPMRVALFTDTLGDVNGVSRFIRNAAEQARRTGRDFTVFTSTNFAFEAAPNIVNVPPVVATKMPKYENLELVLPPVTKMLRMVDKMQPDVIHISTPGSVGLVGLLAARMLRCPVVGVYHTDFPAYVDKLFQDDTLTSGCSAYMKWFYASFASIFTRSDDYAGALRELRVPDERVHTLRPGIMIDQFHPRFRDSGVWKRVLGNEAGKDGIVRAIYCGRVSVEKGLPMLSRCWAKAREQLARLGTPAQLIIIGDGPYRKQMQEELRGHDAHFLGFRHGAELSSLYASGDFFVFPSTTDTLGQVVMESQASGLPVLVTDAGGPKEVTRDGETGYVERASDERGWVDRIVDLASNHEKRARMGKAAHEFLQSFSMQQSFEHYWQVHERAWVQHLTSPRNPHAIAPRTDEQARRGVVEDVPTPGANRLVERAARRAQGTSEA
jgi:glycosyltransferase involved in cell wall biosynthesis